jgi:cell division protein FtsB
MKPFRQDSRYAARTLLMRPLFTLFIIVTLAVGGGANAAAFLALPQDQQPFQLGRIETKYDRLSDTTTAQCDLVELGQGAPRLIVLANASFSGREPNKNAIFWLGLASYKGGATRRTQRSFKEATTLYLTTDSTRLEVQVKDYHNDFYELNHLLAESARAEIGREDLRKLLDARSVEGKWGDVDFKISEAALASLKDFISHQVFAAGDR